jgi:hypothetical protein
VLNLPPVTLLDLSTILKEKLGINTFRYNGDPNQICQRAALIVGIPEGEIQIEMRGLGEIDELMAGEVFEWETSKYARDAVRIELNKCLIVTGNAPGEEYGMGYLAEILRPAFQTFPLPVYKQAVLYNGYRRPKGQLQ